jgi:hypothetical protein
MSLIGTIDVLAFRIRVNALVPGARGTPADARLQCSCRHVRSGVYHGRARHVAPPLSWQQRVRYDPARLSDYGHSKQYNMGRR